MKNLLLLFCALLIFSCSKESIKDKNETPETFKVKYEILGTGEVPQIMYSTNDGSGIVERDEDESEWDVSGVSLPFVKELIYTTKIDGENNTYGCARLSISAYAHRSHGRIEEMNIYINGELEDTETEGYYYIPGEHWTPWGSATFKYLRRGGDAEKFTCN